MTHLPPLPLDLEHDAPSSRTHEASPAWQHPALPPRRSRMSNPTFSDTPFFYDRSSDRASYSGASGEEIEGQSWRGGQVGGGVGVGVSLRCFLVRPGRRARRQRARTEGTATTPQEHLGWTKASLK